MPSIMPGTTSGGVVIRSAAGAAITPVGATTPNVYRPAAAFTMTCPQTAHDDNGCPVTPDAGELNAIAGELLALAEAFNPDGIWDCNAVGNIAANFTAWRDATGPGSLQQLIADALAAGDVYLDALQTYNPTTNALTLLMSDGSTVDVDMTDLLDDALEPSTDPGNIYQRGTDGQPYAPCVAWMCADLVP